MGREAILAQLPVGSVGAEIGVHRGDFSVTLLRHVRARRLYLIDPWRFADDPLKSSSWYGGSQGRGQANIDRRYRRVLRRFADEIRTGTVIVHRGSSVDVAAKIPDASLDWVYIDGDHSYEGVSADLRTYVPKLRKGGLLAGDDYSRSPAWWGEGLRRAVHEFVQAHDAEAASPRR